MSETPSSSSSSVADNPRTRPQRRWLKRLAGLFAGLLAVAVLAVAGLWWWAGSDGSLATALRWIGQSQALTAEGVSGSLRAGGKVARLSWRQDGLAVDAGAVDLAWQPWSLLHGTLKLDRLAAATVAVHDKRPPSTEPARPPDLLGLPLPIALDSFSVGRFDYAGASSFSLSSIAGSYSFNGFEHKLLLADAQLANGRYKGAATLGSRKPLQLEASLAGLLETAVPGSSRTLPLSFTASASGPLTELGIKAELQMQGGATSSVTPGTQAHATATARITPWAAQPVAEADASFRALDLAALWPEAPQTRLTGYARVRPQNTGVAASTSWALLTQMDNAIPGPWDQQRLPVSRLQADAQWLDGAAIVRSLKASVGGGEIVASGQWSAPAAASPTVVTGTPTSTATGTTSVAKDWKLDATLAGINPAAIHTRLAAAPLGGSAAVRSEGQAVGFDLRLQSSGGKSAGNALRLRDANATGSWNAGQAGGTLLLSALRVRSDDAELIGNLEVQPAARGGKGKLSLTAPGLDTRVQGELRQASGAGELSVQARDTQQFLRWLQALPGAPAELRRVSASGRSDLKLDWQGGWSDPALQAKLGIAALDWSGAAAATTPRSSATAATTTATTTATATPAGPLKLRELDASVAGKLSQAQIAVQGRLEAGERRYALRLAADGGRNGGGRPASLDALAASAWQAVVKQLSVAVEDPALGTGAWRLASRGNFDLRYTPAKTSGLFEAGAGEAVLTAPTRAAQGSAAAGTNTAPSQAVLAWQPVRWRGGELTTAGKLSGLPLAWVELFAGPQMAGAGLTGNLVFDGSWDAALGDTLRLKASMARSSGDITVQGETGSGAATRVAAGVREARLTLDSSGDALKLALRWDSERAGTADGQLDTRLSRSGEGWSWPGTAPLSGRLRAQLPRIGVWSVLAPPGWRLRGSLATDLAISGTRAAPQLAGELRANDLALRSVVDGIEFGNGKLRARLDGTRMRIEEFTLQGAGPNNSGGSLTAQGEAGWVAGQPQVQLDATLNQLRASIRTDRQVTLSGKLQAQHDGKLTQFGGALKIDQARILLPEEGTPQLGDDVIVRSASGAAAAGQKAPAETASPKTAATGAQREGRALRIAVDIDLGSDFRIQGKGIDTRIAGKLALTGDSLAEPRLVGSVNTRGGQYRAYGQRLDVEQGLLRFSGPIDNPALDILAVRPNLTQRVGVQITGTALLPRVRLYAQPELPDAEKLSWLVLGRSSASGGAEATLLQQAALALLGSKGGGMSGGLAASLGLDELSYRSASNNADGSTTEGAVTLGKRFSRNFYAAYERSISGALGTLFVFYDISRRFTVRAQTGDQSAIDLIFTVPFD